jgi:hypothetical protein
MLGELSADEAAQCLSGQSLLVLQVAIGEAADRLAIRELIEAYAHCADRRDAKGQMSLFTPDTHFIVYMAPNPLKPHGLASP